jgi:hypothetical protein
MRKETVMKKYIEPMVNMYTGSEDYLKPFGIRVVYANGEQKSFCGNHRDVLCVPLTKKQRTYANILIKQIEGDDNATDQD